MMMQKTSHVRGSRITSLALMAVLLGAGLGGVLWRIGGIPSFQGSFSLPSQMAKFSSYEELRAFVNRTGPQGYPYAVYEALPRGVVTGGIAPNAKLLAATDFSGTNIQVEGVDEADLVKTDGKYIYVVTGKMVVVAKAYPPEQAAILSKIELNQTARNIYVNRDRLVVFLDNEETYLMRPDKKVIPPRGPSTVIRVYDVSDRTAPKLERNLSADGYYANSRMIGDYVYVVATQAAYLYEGEISLPTIKYGQVTEQVDATTIYYANYSDLSRAFTNILAINVQDPSKPISHQTFLLGSACNIYVSLRHIYFTSPRYQDVGSEVLYGTSLNKISIEGEKISYVADGFVPGWVLNQFSMDEYEGDFRVATTAGRVSKGGFTSKNNVYVLNASMSVVGKLEDLAPGEQIHSARFMGARCYLVTFKKVDPLFVIDLGNPKDPKVLGKLKIPGYSDYLHPYDENHLIGVGKETVEAEQGDFAWYQGVKLSLFDISDVSNPKELAKIEIGDRGTDTPVLSDHKAFLFSKNKNLLALPILLAEINPNVYSEGVPANAYGTFVYQGAYVYEVTLTEGFKLRGRITHMDGKDDLVKSGYYFQSEYSVERILYIEDALYTISDRMIRVDSLDDLTLINSLKLP